ncbi:hypothetical protein ACFQS7_03480 [Dankookia sp. GCM10030260]|uniref:hypothetical protein n=1 Tax=Dankookia sp. GCM10030260 TaxID=3273390 RepID=UPI003619E131
MSEDDPRAIEPPQKSPVGMAVRTTTEAAVEVKDRDGWAGEVTGRAKARDRVLRPTVTMSGTTAGLGEWVVRTSTDGLHEPHVDLEGAAAALGAEHPLSAVEEAAEGLEGFGVIEPSRYIGGAILRPGWTVFTAFDPQVKDWDVEKHARALAVLAVQMREELSAHDMEQRRGSERRRFDPPLF